MLHEACIFCRIIKGIIPCHKVYETAKTLAIMDINPISTGHILLIPKFHGERLHDIPEDILSDILPLAKRIASVDLMPNNIAYNILQNNGRLAHQEVGHVHFHLIPKRDTNEGLGIIWNTKSASQEELGKYASSISEELTK